MNDVPKEVRETRLKPCLTVGFTYGPLCVRMPVQLLTIHFQELGITTKGMKDGEVTDCLVAEFDRGNPRVLRFSVER